MGLFDTVWASARGIKKDGNIPRAALACAYCGKIERRAVQLKHAENSLDSYEVGDYVVGVPAGQVALQGVFDCPCGGEEEIELLEKTVTRLKRRVTECWVHFDNGFITAVTRERSAEPKRLSWEMVEHLGRTAQKRKWPWKGSRTPAGLAWRSGIRDSQKRVIWPVCGSTFGVRRTNRS